MLSYLLYNTEYSKCEYHLFKDQLFENNLKKKKFLLFLFRFHFDKLRSNALPQPANSVHFLPEALVFRPVSRNNFHPQVRKMIFHTAANLQNRRMSEIIILRKTHFKFVFFSNLCSSCQKYFCSWFGVDHYAREVTTQILNKSVQF